MKNRFSQFLPFCAAVFTLFALVLVLLPGCKSPSGLPHESGFHSLFDGQSLSGWKLMDANGDGYGVTNGVLYCARGGGGNLMTEKEYGNFILRFEFKLEDGSNNGIGIRAPLEGDAAYVGMEIQILEEVAANRGKWGKLRPDQYHGSIYGVVAAQQGALRPPGEWNTEEITARGRRIKVVVNDNTILDADLNDVDDPATIAKHPGLFRDRGHIGLLGHDDYLEFRNIRIKELPATTREGVPPTDFTSVFDGKSLAGWKGLVDDPKRRATMTPTELANAQAVADKLMRADWKVEGGALVYRGTNFDNLCTVKDFVNFELLADWKIEPYSDSGIYLRGTPQVQIWDPYTQPTKNGSEAGSGGLYNNKKGGTNPLMVADKPIGEWNRFRIIMAGDNVHVFLNGELVVNDAALENYWQRDLPVFPFGPIELQAHKSVVWFKNLYIRELHQPAK
jgi:3-keto-disaccharide hydrolase